MKLKFFFVLILLATEAGYAGKMILHTNDQDVVKTVINIPVFGDIFYEHRIRETRARAKDGDVHEMMALFYRADEMKHESDRSLALELLEHSGSATAELFLAAREGRLMENQSSREFMLLVARAMKENIRPYLPEGDDNAAYTQQSKEYSRAFETLQQQAQSGDADAAWVLAQIGLNPDGTARPDTDS